MREAEAQTGCQPVARSGDRHHSPSLMSALTEGVVGSPETGLGTCTPSVSALSAGVAQMPCDDLLVQPRSGKTGSERAPQSQRWTLAGNQSPAESALTEGEGITRLGTRVGTPRGERSAAKPGTPSLSVSALTEGEEWPSPSGPDSSGVVKTVSRVTYGTAEDSDNSSSSPSVSAFHENGHEPEEEPDVLPCEPVEAHTGFEPVLLLFWLLMLSRWERDTTTDTKQDITYTETSLLPRKETR